jgi:hypothetical protein
MGGLSAFSSQVCEATWPSRLRWPKGAHRRPIAGICALLLIVGLIVWGGSNGNNNTASNSPGQIAPQASTTGAAPNAPAPGGRAATPRRSTTGSGQ